jgi:hypothetical protein
VCYLQVFQIDSVALPHQSEGYLVVKVGALSSNLLVLPSQPLHGLLASLTPLLATRDSMLSLLQRLFCPAILAGILDHLTRGGHQKHREPNIDPCLLTAARQGLHRHIDAGETYIPAIGLFANGNRLDGARNRSAPNTKTVITWESPANRLVEKAAACGGLLLSISLERCQTG